ncbi:MAG: ABC transporter ATP-binding protein [Gemmatimonadota bacterium]
MLELAGVTKRFRGGVTAVADFSLTLTRGVLGLLGPNGAGKTTLMQMIATITAPTSGRISFDGVDLATDPDHLRRRLGYLPQDFGVYDNLTAFEFLSYFGALKGIRSKAKVHELLELVNLHTVAHRPAGTFSGGMRQRLGIAQALINDPDVVIVDEPTAGLDPEERVRFRNILSDVGYGKLVILSTHIVTDIESVATAIAVMKQGRLLGCTAPEALLQRAAGSVWQAVLSSERFEVERARVRISHAVRKPDGVHVRVVQPTAPFPDALPADPDLEDAFLYVMNFAEAPAASGISAHA